MEFTVDFGIFADELADVDRFLLQGNFNASEVACKRILDAAESVLERQDFRTPLIKSSAYQRIVVVEFARRDFDSASEATTRADVSLDEAENLGVDEDHIEVITRSREHFESVKAHLWDPSVSWRRPRTSLFEPTGHFRLEPLMMTAVCQHRCRVVALPCGFTDQHCKPI